MIGPCAKQTVTATIVALDGTYYIGTNHTFNPQKICPRIGMPTGVGYHLCKDVCQQPSHAEINALRLAGDAANGATLYLEGHTYACASCIDECEKYGIVEIVIGRAPKNESI
jgi:deoxycytidylate deaminase